MKLSYKSIGVLLLTAFIICLPLITLAENTGSGGGNPNTGSGGGNPNTGSGGAQSYTLQNPLKGNVTSFCQVLEMILRAVIIIGLPIAVVFLMWVGFQFIIARGSTEGLALAKRNLLYTVAGIAIFLGAWTIAQIIKNTMQALGVGSFGSC